MPRMRFTTLIAAPLALLAPEVIAFECPKHFADAKSAIAKVEQDMQAMGSNMDQEDKALVHALLDDAKMLLHGAEHNHEKPQGAFDHARAIAKADSARGHAQAAGMLHGKFAAQ